jgi:hypothetical protein
MICVDDHCFLVDLQNPNSPSSAMAYPHQYPTSDLQILFGWESGAIDAEDKGRVGHTICFFGRDVNLDCLTHGEPNQPGSHTRKVWVVCTHHQLQRLIATKP